MAGTRTNGTVGGKAGGIALALALMRAFRFCVTSGGLLRDLVFQQDDITIATLLKTCNLLPCWLATNASCARVRIEYSKEDLTGASQEVSS